MKSSIKTFTLSFFLISISKVFSQNISVCLLGSHSFVWEFSNNKADFEAFFHQEVRFNYYKVGEYMENVKNIGDVGIKIQSARQIVIKRYKYCLEHVEKDYDYLFFVRPDMFFPKKGKIELKAGFHTSHVHDIYISDNFNYVDKTNAQKMIEKSKVLTDAFIHAHHPIEHLLYKFVTISNVNIVKGMPPHTFVRNCQLNDFHNKKVLHLCFKDFIITNYNKNKFKWCNYNKIEFKDRYKENKLCIQTFLKIYKSYAATDVKNIYSLLSEKEKKDYFKYFNEKSQNDPITCEKKDVEEKLSLNETTTLKIENKRLVEANKKLIDQNREYSEINENLKLRYISEIEDMQEDFAMLKSSYEKKINRMEKDFFEKLEGLKNTNSTINSHNDALNAFYEKAEFIDSSFVVIILVIIMVLVLICKIVLKR